MQTNTIFKWMNVSSFANEVTFLKCLLLGNCHSKNVMSSAVFEVVIASFLTGLKSLLPPAGAGGTKRRWRGYSCCGYWHVGTEGKILPLVAVREQNAALLLAVPLLSACSTPLPADGVLWVCTSAYGCIKFVKQLTANNCAKLNSKERENSVSHSRLGASVRTHHLVFPILKWGWIFSTAITRSWELALPMLARHLISLEINPVC